MKEWQLKRTDTNAVIQLHAQYSWSNEHEWTPIAQSSPVYTLTGAMVVQQGTKKAGRPITLDGSVARISRADVQMLRSWSSVAELKMRLTHPDGRVFEVIFSRPVLSDLKAIKPVRPADEQPDDVFVGHIHFVTV